jgi:hypothetical protein
MTTDKDRYIQLAAKLLELTQEGKLNWRVIQPRRTLTDDPARIVSVVYSARFKEKNLGLYQIQTKYEEPPVGSLSASSAIRMIIGTPPPVWQYDTVLEFIDESDNCLWTFPHVSGLADLYKAVKFQVAGVAKFLDDVLGSET